ncbi:hypothetical protein Fcan01_23951 [Folsomia candida]|uniref:Uncharacterized protein n=1 Tax=Folsomia candida TaxID=158441 RepID=A0A226D953_FOLCA|nr:hypothetical protein Fcan01_23951 [Folsomia candida]
MRQSGINLRVVRIVVHLRPELSTIIGIIIIIPRGSSISSCLLILGTPTQHPSIPSASLDRRSDRPDSPPTSTLVSIKNFSTIPEQFKANLDTVSSPIAKSAFPVPLEIYSPAPPSVTEVERTCPNTKSTQNQPAILRVMNRYGKFFNFCALCSS